MMHAITTDKDRNSKIIYVYAPKRKTNSTGVRSPTVGSQRFIDHEAGTKISISINPRQRKPSITDLGYTNNKENKSSIDVLIRRLSVALDVGDLGSLIPSNDPIVHPSLSNSSPTTPATTNNSNSANPSTSRAKAEAGSNKVNI